MCLPFIKSNIEESLNALPTFTAFAFGSYIILNQCYFFLEAFACPRAEHPVGKACLVKVAADIRKHW